MTGEDTDQVNTFINEYFSLVDKISLCNLPISLKVSALNNMALAKIIHHFYNTRLEVTQLKLMDNKLTEIIRNIFKLYKSTIRCVMYLPREIGGIGVKKYQMCIT